MMPTGVFAENPAPGRIRFLRRPEPLSLNDLGGLERRSDRPDVQRFLQEAIRQGRVRVQPCPGQPGRVKIMRSTPDPSAGATPRRV